MPAPFGMALAILQNTEMLTVEEKLRMVPALLPMLVEGQSFIAAQDELSVLDFMRKYGMPERINEEIFIAMGKASACRAIRRNSAQDAPTTCRRSTSSLPDKLSMTVVLTAMNRFINEADGSQTAFLDGNQPDRLCAPMAAHVEARGGEVRVGAPVREIVVGPASGRVQKLRLGDGSEVVADMYVSAAPVDIFKKMMPPARSPTSRSSRAAAPSAASP